MALDAQWSAVARGYRYALISAVLLGVAAIAVSVVFGALYAGLFGCAGLVLGSWNSRRLWDDTQKLTGSEPNPKQHVVMSSGKRLAVVTLIAFLVAVAYRQYGWAVFVGLVVFQFLMMGLLIKPLRHVVAQ